MEVAGDDILCGWNIPDHLLRRFYILLHTQQSKWQDHQSTDLIPNIPVMIDEKLINYIINRLHYLIIPSRFLVFPLLSTFVRLARPLFIECLSCRYSRALLLCYWRGGIWVRKVSILFTSFLLWAEWWLSNYPRWPRRSPYRFPNFTISRSIQ